MADMDPSTKVRLNVGGVIYTTSRSTLCQYPDSMLDIMFSGKFQITYDDAGCAFIDRDGKMFGHVLNFLRSGKLVLPSNFDEFELLESDADFYQIQQLIDAVKERRDKGSGRGNPVELIELLSEDTEAVDEKNAMFKSYIDSHNTYISCRKDLIKRYIPEIILRAISTEYQFLSKIPFSKPLDQVRYQLIRDGWECKGKSLMTKKFKMTIDDSVLNAMRAGPNACTGTLPYFKTTSCETFVKQIFS